MQNFQNLSESTVFE